MNDSELEVNGWADSSRKLFSETARPANMASNRDEVVSGYVRMRIREWQDSGRELQELARAAGFSKATPSQTMRGTGVAGKTGPKFAKVFGFKSFDDMKMAAWTWWQEQGHAGPAILTEPPTEALAWAVEAMLDLKQGTRAQIETILTAYSHPRFRDRDREWWTRTLLEELQRDRERLKADERARAEGRKADDEAAKKLSDAREKRTPKVSKVSPKARRSGVA